MTERLITFLARWYGQPDRPARMITHAGNGIDPDLGRWWATISRWRDPLVQFNRPVEPVSLLSQEGFVVFWIENQGGLEWSYRDSAPASSVYVRSEGPWVDTGRSVADFLFEMTLYEAAIDAPHAARAKPVPRAEVEKLRIGGDRYRLGDWAWPAKDAELHVEGSHLVDVMPSFGVPDHCDVGYSFSTRTARDDWLSRYAGGVELISCDRHQGGVVGAAGHPPPF